MVLRVTGVDWFVDLDSGTDIWTEARKNRIEHWFLTKVVKIPDVPS